MPRRLPLPLALLVGLAAIGQAGAQELPPTPGGSLASQRQWLLQQVRIGEATGRQHPGARTGLAHMIGLGTMAVAHVLHKE